TTDQGGPTSSAHTTPELRGRDNYFNNGVYRDGWSYHGNTIGSPFMIPYTQITGFEYKGRTDRLIANNRVKALSVGLKSRAGIFDLLTRLSYSKNWGSYRDPLNAAQTSIQQTVSFPIRTFAVQAGLFYDQGDLLEKNLGLQLAVKRSF